MSRGEDNMSKYYPIMLDIRDRFAIVVGGDCIAVEKAAALSASGAHVTVLSPEFCNETIVASRTKACHAMAKDI